MCRNVPVRQVVTLAGGQLARGRTNTWPLKEMTLWKHQATLCRITLVLSNAFWVLLQILYGRASVFRRTFRHGDEHHQFRQQEIGNRANQDGQQIRDRVRGAGDADK
jgi:hypothetical protein